MGGGLASEVQHFENEGAKYKKHGVPNKVKLAKEVQDVLRSALQICSYYGAEKELEQSIQVAFLKLQEEGYLSDDGSI